MDLPYRPDQIILFTSDDDSFGVGEIIPVQIKQITKWNHRETDDEPILFVEYTDIYPDETVDRYLPYLSFQSLPESITMEDMEEQFNTDYYFTDIPK